MQTNMPENRTVAERTALPGSENLAAPWGQRGDGREVEAARWAKDSRRGGFGLIPPEALMLQFSSLGSQAE